MPGFEQHPRADLDTSFRELRTEFAIEFAASPEAQREVFELRYQVYCEERSFERGVNGQEADAFDIRSRHLLLRHRSSGRAVGTVRLVMPRGRKATGDLPMERISRPPVIAQLPRDQLAEVSRFALSKRWRAAEGCQSGQLRLALVRGLIQLSAELGVEYWCALMEPTLLRLLRLSSIYFHRAGDLVEHHGLRQPSYVRVDEMLRRMRLENSALWNFLTQDGASSLTVPTEMAA